MKQQNWLLNQMGFTLFELLVVVSIIGILLGLASVGFSTAQKKARDARRVEDMQTIQKALEQYYALSGGSYPTSCYSSGDTIQFGETILLSSFPTDPKNQTPYIYSGSNCSISSYCYCARLETTNGNSGANCDWSAATKYYYCVTARQ